MSTTEKNSNSPKTDWYAHWFGPRYDALYGHRNPAQAEIQVAQVLKYTGSLQGAVLDLGCGAGRHLAALKAQGIQAIGLDLSAWLIAQAQVVGRPVLRASMAALPFQSHSFAAVFSFFSSFGYFPTREDDLQILAQMSQLVQKDGFLFLDLPNKAPVVQGIYDSKHSIDGETVYQSRYIDGDCVVKRIDWHQKDGQVQTYFEKLRLWEEFEIRQALESLGFKVIDLLGDEYGNPYTLLTPRMSFMAQRREL